jgi:hypothetical protein
MIMKCPAKEPDLIQIPYTPVAGKQMELHYQALPNTEFAVQRFADRRRYVTAIRQALAKPIAKTV